MNARTTFNQARRKWSQARDVERAHAKAEKEAIIAEANQLKDSTAWGETSRRFNELMDRWKRAGRVGRSDDDALWAQFRKAADEFFNARQADRDQISTSEKENLAKKEELLKKAEALVPVADEAAAKKARQALGVIQDEWDQIGYVPRDDMRRIEGRLDAVDKQIKAIEDVAVVVTIITDGYENASKEYNGSSIKALVETLRKEGWTFTYMGANQDSMEVAMSMSIRNARNFDYSSEGTRASMRKDTTTRMNFFSRLSQMKNEAAFCAEPMSKEERLGCYGRLADEAFDEEENK